jgi:2-haloacid dehalogenase
MKPYRLLLFDADDTLFDYTRAEAHALAYAFAHFKLEYRPEFHLALYRKINLRIWDEFERQLITSAELRPERFRRYCKELGIDSIPAEEFSRVYLQGLAQGSFLVEGAVEVIAALAPYFQLALLSNGLSEVQRPRWSNSRLDTYFPVRVISDEIGVAKPAPGIFAYALKACGHEDKATVLMIGDSLTSDIAGGNAFGIDTCWYNPSHRPIPPDNPPTYVIRSLGELPTLLRQNE